MKKLSSVLAIALSVLMILCSLPMAAMATDTEPTTDYEWIGDTVSVQDNVNPTTNAAWGFYNGTAMLSGGYVGDYNQGTGYLKPYANAYTHDGGTAVKYRLSRDGGTYAESENYGYAIDVFEPTISNVNGLAVWADFSAFQYDEYWRPYVTNNTVNSRIDNTSGSNVTVIYNAIRTAGDAGALAAYTLQDNTKWTAENKTGTATLVNTKTGEVITESFTNGINGLGGFRVPAGFVGFMYFEFDDKTADMSALGNFVLTRLNSTVSTTTSEDTTVANLNRQSLNAGKDYYLGDVFAVSNVDAFAADILGGKLGKLNTETENAKVYNETVVVDAVDGAVSYTAFALDAANGYAHKATATSKTNVIKFSENVSPYYIQVVAYNTDGEVIAIVDSADKAAFEWIGTPLAPADSNYSGNTGDTHWDASHGIMLATGTAVGIYYQGQMQKVDNAYTDNGKQVVQLYLGRESGVAETAGDDYGYVIDTYCPTISGVNGIAVWADFSEFEYDDYWRVASVDTSVYNRSQMNNATNNLAGQHDAYDSYRAANWNTSGKSGTATLINTKTGEVITESFTSATASIKGAFRVPAGFVGYIFFEFDNKEADMSTLGGIVLYRRDDAINTTSTDTSVANVNQQSLNLHKNYAFGDLYAVADVDAFASAVISGKLGKLADNKGCNPVSSGRTVTFTAVSNAVSYVVNAYDAEYNLISSAATSTTSAVLNANLSGAYIQLLAYDADDKLISVTDNAHSFVTDGNIWYCTECDAEIDATYTAHFDTKKADKTEYVEIDFVIDSNPGFALAEFEINYDNSVLTLVEINDAGKFETAMHNDGKDGNPVVLSFGHTGGNDATGKVATLCFLVAENANYGDYAISATCTNFADTLGIDGLTPTFDVTSGAVRLLSNELVLPDTNADGVKFSNTVSAELNGAITVNFHIDPTYLAEGDIENGAYAVVISPNISEDNTLLINKIKMSNTEKIKIDENGRYVISCDVVAAKLTEDITVTLYNANGEKLFSRINYSIADYLNYVVDNFSGKEIANLAKALLNYGASVQTYFGYNTDNLANSNIPDYVVDLTAEEVANAIADRNYVKKSGNSIALASTTFVALEDSVVRHKFALRSSDYSIGDYTATLKMGDGEAVQVELIEDTTADRWYIEIPDIAAADLDTEYTIVITYADDTEITLTTNALYYAKSMLTKYGANESYASLNNMLIALYNYNVAANTYFENAN